MNLQNNNNNTGKYPLYLGEELGLLDNTNETYPQIAGLRDQLLRDAWNWLEIDLKKDSFDIQNPALSESTAAMTRNLEFQYLTDSLVACNIYQIMGNYCTNTEMLNALQQWEWSESVHALQYSEIVKKAYKDPNALINDMKLNKALNDRLQPVIDIFANAKEMSMHYALGTDKYTEEEHRENIIRFHMTLLAVEGIAFAASFAATFAVCKASKAFDGIKNSVALITRDELDSHVKLGVEVLKILKEEWAAQYAKVAAEMADIYSLVLALEADWAHNYLFEGVKVRGLNAKNLVDYATFLAGGISDIVSIPVQFDRVEKDPLPFMQEYLNLGDIQVAAQESQIVQYNLNILNDDVDSDKPFGFNL